MATAPAAKANAAFVDEDYDLALALYKQVALRLWSRLCLLVPHSQHFTYLAAGY